MSDAGVSFPVSEEDQRPYWGAVGQVWVFSHIQYDRDYGNQYDDGKRGYGAAGGGGRFWRPQCDRPVFYWKYSGEGCSGAGDETAPGTHTEPDGNVPEHAEKL